MSWLLRGFVGRGFVGRARDAMLLEQAAEASAGGRGSAQATGAIDDRVSRHKDGADPATLDGWERRGGGSSDGAAVAPPRRRREKAPSQSSCAAEPGPSE